MTKRHTQSMVVVAVMTFIMMVLVASQAVAQEGVSAEKRALIKELLALTQSDKNVNAIMNSAMAQVQQDVVKTLSREISETPTLTAAEEEQLQKKMKDVTERAGKLFREKLAQRVSFSKQIENISYPIYDKYFTADELKDLIAFYKSSTGQKTIQVMPQLISESMQRTSAALLDELQQISNEVTEEMKASRQADTKGKAPDGKPLQL